MYVDTALTACYKYFKNVKFVVDDGLHHDM